jgi:hypothetical protein
MRIAPPTAPGSLGLAVLAAGLGVLLGLLGSRLADQLPGPGVAEAQMVLSVPRDYGKLVGFLGARAFFEAPDGTIRGVGVDGSGAAPLVTVITRR